MKLHSIIMAVVFACFATSALAGHHHTGQDDRYGVGLSNATVLVIRHAEKPDTGVGLTPQGQARALAYPAYFKTFHIDGRPITIDTLVATADTSESQRPRLTLEPLSRATGLAIQQPFEDRAVKELARWLQQGAPNRTILIAWHHGRLPKLIAELGADPNSVLPSGAWPENIYDWVVVLRFDRDGLLIPGATTLVREQF